MQDLLALYLHIAVAYIPPQKRSKPKADPIPTSISYRVTVIQIDAEISNQRIRCGRFILATNILDPSQFSADDAL